MKPEPNSTEVFTTIKHPQGQTVTVLISWGDQFLKARLTPAEAADLRDKLTAHLEGGTK